jgi:transposase
MGVLCYGMARPVRQLEAAPAQREELEKLVRAGTAPLRLARRARIVLLRSSGISQQETARMVGVSRVVVSRWENRFRQEGVNGLNEAGRRGRKCSLDLKVKEGIVADATRPPAPRKRWSIRTMAKAKGVAPSTVQRLWHSNDIRPHITRTFKVSRDPHFEEKFWDVVGLYLNPPDRAIVLCCDEKSQCQALERSQPGLPLGVGHIRTRTHDYTRHGTITLFAALDYLAGKIFRRMGERHTHAEWLDFLKHLDCEIPDGLTLHIVLDNYATHKHPKVKSWIKWRNQRHAKQYGNKRIVLHFIPTSSSWMNMVERFFRDLTEDVIREGSFAHVNELVADIEAYMQERDLDPKRYVWKAKGAEVLAKVMRARAKLGLNVL